MHMKPIETMYNDFKFRSRIEAKWAVFFDLVGISYDYEKEGYNLGEAGLYLPDFWLPASEYWIEIKGKPPTPSEINKAKGLCVATESTVLIFVGEPYYPIANTAVQFMAWPDALSSDLIINDPDNGPVGYGYSRSERGTVCISKPYSFEWEGEIVHGQAVTFNENGPKDIDITSRRSMASHAELWESTPQYVLDAFKKVRQERFDNGSSHYRRKKQRR